MVGLVMVGVGVMVGLGMVGGRMVGLGMVGVGVVGLLMVVGSRVIRLRMIGVVVVELRMIGVVVVGGRVRVVVGVDGVMEVNGMVWVYGEMVTLLEGGQSLMEGSGAKLGTERLVGQKEAVRWHQPVHRQG